MNPHSLTIEEQRQLVYSSLLRFTSETATLRERVLDRIVLGALIGSTQEAPFRTGAIVGNLCLGSQVLTVRIETVQEALTRLVKQGKVNHTAVRRGDAFYLAESGETELLSVMSSAEGDFSDALQRMLKDTAHLVDFDTAALVCRRFILECFARFGRTIARSVTGHVRPDDLPNLIDTTEAFTTAIEGRTLSAEAMQSVRARCNAFLKSSDQRDQRVKFHLTQSYYFAQLLGFEDSAFNPLRDHVFGDAILYLDTNVIFAGVLQIAETVPLFDELIRLTGRLGISLRVTRITINETRNLAQRKLNELKQALKVLPKEVIQHTSDQFVLAYLDAREKRPTSTPDDIAAPFQDLAQLLTTRWKIEIEDRVEEDLIAEPNAGEVCRIIDEEAQAMRGWGKSQPVQRHDACHYFIVQHERAKGHKAWFLTRDRTLAAAAAKLANPGESHFSLGLIGFLHSISPFVTTPEEEDSLVSVLSKLMTDQVFAVGPMFDASELALLAEFHEDVVATPAEQLLLALDFIKSKTLEGKPYRPEDIPRVSLELRKFLSSSKDEQYQALESERARLAAVAAAESHRRAEAERTISSLRDAENAQTEKVTKAEESARSSERKAHRSQLILRAVLMVLGWAIAATLWLNSHELAVWLLMKYPDFLKVVSLDVGNAVLSGMGVVVAALPTFACVLKLRIRFELRVAILVIIAAVILAISRALNEARLSFLADCLGVAAPFAVLAIAAWKKSKDSGVATFGG
jgi:hypothetical protein